MTFVPEITGTVTTTWAKGPGNTQVEEGHVIPVAIAENQRGEVRTSDVSPSIANGGGKPGQGYPAVLAPTLRPMTDDNEPVLPETPQITGAILTNWGGSIGANNAVDAGAYIPVPTPAVLAEGSLAVRRLTPRECERLMGWPDDWTRFTADGTEVADSHRYRMCGNGVASPVAEWVGRCILKAAS